MAQRGSTNDDETRKPGRKHGSEKTHQKEENNDFRVDKRRFSFSFWGWGVGGGEG